MYYMAASIQQMEIFQISSQKNQPDIFSLFEKLWDLH